MWGDLHQTVVRWRGKVLYWGVALDRLAIQERRLERRVRVVLNYAALLLAVFGVGFFFWELLVQPAAVFQRTYWTAQYHPAALWLLVGLVSAAYVLYRFVLEQTAHSRIAKPRYGQSATDAPMEAIEWTTARQTAKRDRVDIAAVCAPDALRAIEEAYLLAAKLGHAAMTPLHLTAALATTMPVGLLMARLDIGGKALAERIERHLGTEPGTSGGVTQVAPACTQAIFEAYQEAVASRQTWLRPTELMIVLLRQKGVVQDVFADFGVDQQKMENVVAWVRVVAELKERWLVGKERARFRPSGGMNRAMTAVATPMLNRMSDDLTALAQDGYLPPFVDRESLTEQVFRVLAAGSQHVLLVGAHGTGKEALLFGIAQRMVEDDVPEPLRDKRLISLSIPKIVSGASPAEVAERVSLLMVEAARAGNIVFAIPNIHGLVGLSAGGARTVAVADVLADGLKRSKIKTLATTTPEDDTAVFAASPLGKDFERVAVLEPDRNEAIRILEAKAGGIEQKAHVYFSYDALAQAVDLAGRYMPDRHLPEKAIEMIKEAAELARQGGKDRVKVDAQAVAAVIAQKSNMPLEAVAADESAVLLGLEDVLHERMVGQDEAVSAVARAVRRARADVRTGHRPIANLLFLGPTGVGKTELAKTVAEAYFGRSGGMIRFDMSEYHDAQSLHRLLGDAATGTGGLLTEAVRKQPFAVLLLDEMEKAHPDALNLLLQIMDDGRLTDALGRTADFSNIMLIATSNAAAKEIQEGIAAGQPLDALHDQLMNGGLAAWFRPEFLNRFDGIILFRPLDQAEIQEVARRMLQAVARQLEAKGIAVQFTEAAVAEIGAAGFDPIYGARPLRRIIQERVQDVLADLVLAKKVDRRDTVVFGEGGEVEVQKPTR